MKKIMQKRNNKAGFTLAETLVTVLILLMVSAVVAGGVPAASNAYMKAVDAANAHVLLSTTVNALRSELVSAREVENKDSNTITYYNSMRGSRSMIKVDEGGVIKLQEYVADEMATGAMTTEARSLVSNAATVRGKLSVTCTGIKYEDGIVTVSGLNVSRNDTVIAQIPESGLQIRVISGEKTA